MDNSNSDMKEKGKKFLTRTHPEYELMLPHWQFLRSCYEGGRHWFATNIFRYIKEGDTEYTDRVKRAYRFNHTREVVDLLDKYLFKMSAARSENVPAAVKKFWKHATKSRLSIQDYIKQISKMSSIYGLVWVVVDNNLKSDSVSLAEEKKSKARIFSHYITPEHVINLSYDEEGKLNWILLHESVRDDLDPLESTCEIEHRYRLWTRDEWMLFKLSKKQNAAVASTNLSSAQIANAVVKAFRGNLPGLNAAEEETFIDLNQYEIDIDGPYPHNLGIVPVFPAYNTISDGAYSSTSLIDDVAYLDRAVANYLSNLDAVIQDQTYSQLTMPAQGLMPGEDGYDAMLKMGTKRIFTYDAQGGGKPEYISPDASQAEIILKVINKIINEIYHSVGLAGERTKQDNALGIDNSSGVAKAYDFERVNSLLAAKADSLENVENQLVRLVRLWSGDTDEMIDEDETYVSYPDNFDVRGLYDEFEIAITLGEISAPDSVRRHQMEQVIDKLFPKLSADIKKEIAAELKSWPPAPIDVAGNAPSEDTPGAKPTASQTSAKPAGTEATA